MPLPSHGMRLFSRRTIAIALIPTLKHRSKAEPHLTIIPKTQNPDQTQAAFSPQTLKTVTTAPNPLPTLYKTILNTIPRIVLTKHTYEAFLLPTGQYNIFFVFIFFPKTQQRHSLCHSKNKSKRRFRLPYLFSPAIPFSFSETLDPADVIVLPVTSHPNSPFSRSTMGCGSSKLDEIDAVGFCRDRSELLAEAIRHRYDFAGAHAAYADSLRSVSVAVHQLVNIHTSPVLPLPVHRKGDISPPPPPAIGYPHSRSQSGSHINFHSSTDSDSDDESTLNIQYARNNPSSSSTFSYYLYDDEQRYPVQNTYPSPYAYQPNPYGYKGMEGFFGSSSSPTPAMSQHLRVGSAVNSKPLSSVAAAAPPSPPRANTWDFLNPFESFESYYPTTYSSGRNSKDMREDEGIPELEEEDEQEVVKEAYGDRKFDAFASEVTAVPEGGSAVDKDVGGSENCNERLKEEEVVKVNVVQRAHEERRYVDVSEVAREIKFQFEKAAESIEELSVMLEVGRQPYKRKSSVYAVSSKMLCVIPVSMWRDDEDLDYEEEKVMSTGNLSSTLQKLYIWEQKLHDEVRVEKKMRLLHDRNSQKLHQLDRKGAESHKIEATQTLIRKLSTKIRIEIQVANSISKKIVILRDEELWPQIAELIQGLQRMWRVMLECHQAQSHAISEANYLDYIASGEKLSHEHMKAIMQLEVELLRWTGNFSSWINSQKNFVKSLNSWLLLCLHYEPEVTDDGIPPYSPGRMGAPPVFVMFNNWSQALEGVSVKEVLDAMKSSAAILKHVGEGGDTEPREKMIVIREVERLNKKLALSSGKDDFPLTQPPHAEPVRLHAALKLVFEAVENFAADAMDAYEVLHVHAAHERAATEEAGGSQV